MRGSGLLIKYNKPDKRSLNTPHLRASSCSGLSLACPSEADDVKRVNCFVLGSIPNGAGPIVEWGVYYSAESDGSHQPSLNKKSTDFQMYCRAVSSLVEDNQIMSSNQQFCLTRTGSTSGFGVFARMRAEKRHFTFRRRHQRGKTGRCKRCQESTAKVALS